MAAILNSILLEDKRVGGSLRHTFELNCFPGCHLSSAHATTCNITVLMQTQPSQELTEEKSLGGLPSLFRHGCSMFVMVGKSPETAERRRLKNEAENLFRVTSKRQLGNRNSVLKDNDSVTLHK